MIKGRSELVWRKTAPGWLEKVGRIDLPSVRGVRISKCSFNRKLNFMADLENSYTQNVAGKYYVDNQCIDCDLCRETAPQNFTRNDDGGHSYVYKQPGSPEEEAQCKEAMEGCPVEAIGNNGK